MDSKLQIFISSTYTDLKSERQAAVEAILKAGHIPAGMELFTAGDRSQWEVIQRWITDADIYMIILGGRYGSIEPDSGTSYTELEYDFAVSCGKPHFAVVIDEDALEKKVMSVGSSVIETDHADKLKAFREKVLSKISSFFSDHKDVKLAVLETVPQLTAEYELKGWMRATEIPDTKALADELSRLHAENKKLRDKLNSQAKELDKKSRRAPGLQEEFAELFKLLTDSEINVTTAKHAFVNADQIPDEVSVLDLMLSFRDSLMGGITNQMGMSDLQKYAFFTLCPKLQTYDLVQNEKVTGVRYRRYVITKKGTQFLAFVDKILHKVESQSQTSPPSKNTPVKEKSTRKKNTANNTSGGDGK